MANYFRKLKILFFVFMVAFISFTIALTTIEAEGKSYKWKTNHGNSEEHAATYVCKQFAKMAEESSGGRIKMTYYPAGSLGDPFEVMEAIRMGTLEVSVGMVPTSADPRSNVMWMPYLMRTWDEIHAACGPKGWFTPILDEIYSGLGVKILSVFPHAWDGMAFTDKVKKVVKTPAGFKGIKMRTPPVRIYEIYIPTLGFISTPITFSETFTALQTGIVDARSCCPAIEAYVMRDALKYWVNTRDSFEFMFIAINKNLWNSLSADDQTILANAAHKLVSDQIARSKEQEADWIKKLEAAGVKTYKVSQREWEECAKLVREKAWPKIEKELLGPALMNKIRLNATPISK